MDDRRVIHSSKPQMSSQGLGNTELLEFVHDPAQKGIDVSLYSSCLFNTIHHSFATSTKIYPVDLPPPGL